MRLCGGIWRGWRKQGVRSRGKAETGDKGMGFPAILNMDLLPEKIGATEPKTG